MVLLNGMGVKFLPVKHSFRFISWGDSSTPNEMGVKFLPVKFLPVKHSFRFIPYGDCEDSNASDEIEVKFLPFKHSFRCVSWEDSSPPPVFDVVSKNDFKNTSNTSKDQNKRAFLKVAGIAGAGIIASQILPSKAKAFVLGSSPTTGVVGVKNSTNIRINPATEETVSSLLKASDLTFDAGSLQVKITSLPGGGLSSFSDSGDVAKSALVDADRHVQVDVLSSALPTSASTETTLQTISYGGFKFALRMETSGNYDYVGEASVGTATSAASWRVKRIDYTSGIAITWASAGVFDQVWDNYASLSYS